jgi:hypothetical protein
VGDTNHAESHGSRRRAQADEEKALPMDLARKAVEAGWAEVHPAVPLFGLPENRLMIYRPRDEGELEVVYQLLFEAYQFAGGATPS